MVTPSDCQSVARMCQSIEYGDVGAKALEDGNEGHLERSHVCRTQEAGSDGRTLVETGDEAVGQV